MPPAIEVRRSNHWTARVPNLEFFFNVFYLSQFELASKSIMIETVPENICGRSGGIYSVIVIEPFETRNNKRGSSDT